MTSRASRQYPHHWVTEAVSESPKSMDGYDPFNARVRHSALVVSEMTLV